MIPKVLQKLEQDKATGIVVIPRWPTQVWYSMAMRMLISCPVLLQHNARLLLLPSHPQKVNFLADLVKSGVGYSGVNTARSAISTILVISDSATFGTHPLVKRFLKGVFEQKPSLPRYETIWDVSQVLTHLRSYPPVEDISLKKLTFKVVKLLALLTGQRTQTNHCLDVNHMDMSDKKCIFFYLTSLQKNS